MRRWLPLAEVFIGPSLVIAFLWFTTMNRIAFVESIAAFLLLSAAWWSYAHWRRAVFRGLPLFAAVTAMYWLYFGVALFYGDRRALDWKHPFRQVGEDAVTAAILMVLLGVFSLWLGMNSGLGRRAAPRRMPGLLPGMLTLRYLQALAVLGPVLEFTHLTFGGEGFRQVLIALQGTVSLAAFVILLRRVLLAGGTPSEKALLWGVAAVRMTYGISSGWLGTPLLEGMIYALVYLEVRRKLPVRALLLIVPYVLFFQPGKTDFRRIFWAGQTQATTFEKIEFWVEASLKKWEGTLDDPSGEQWRSMFTSVLMRTTLLTQAANVIEQTPAIVPYQYGRLYSYVVINWIPRFLWPDKPTMNEANQFYQVAYQVTSQRDLSSVSIAVGVLTEGYINFGWFGPPLVMFLVGVFLDFWNETFLTGKSMMAMGIGFAMLAQLLVVEYQMAQYISGILQHTVIAMAVFFPIVQWRRARLRPGYGRAMELAGAQQ